MEKKKKEKKTLEPNELFNQFLSFSLPPLLFPGQLTELKPLTLTQQYLSSSNYSAFDWQHVLLINLPQKNGVCFSNLQLQIQVSL